MPSRRRSLWQLIDAGLLSFFLSERICIRGIFLSTHSPPENFQVGTIPPATCCLLFRPLFASAKITAGSVVILSGCTVRSFGRQAGRQKKSFCLRLHDDNHVGHSQWFQSAVETREWKPPFLMMQRRRRRRRRRDACLRQRRQQRLVRIQMNLSSPFYRHVFGLK